MEQNSSIRLFCLPPGGAGASVYRTWSKLLRDEVQIVPVQFPGREHRYGDELRTSIPSLLDDIRGMFGNVKDRFALFGHSLGALVGFEVARDLRRRNLRSPVALFVSGYPAPHLVRSRPKISHLPRETFLDCLLSSFDVATSDRALLEYAYPVLRADFEIVENYIYEPEAPLDCRIIAIGGETDQEATPHQLLAWQRETMQPLVLKVFPGNHFHLYSSPERVIELVQKELAQG